MDFQKYNVESSKTMHTDFEMSLSYFILALNEESDKLQALVLAEVWNRNFREIVLRPVTVWGGWRSQENYQWSSSSNWFEITAEYSTRSVENLSSKSSETCCGISIRPQKNSDPPWKKLPLWTYQSLRDENVEVLCVGAEIIVNARFGFNYKTMFLVTFCDNWIRTTVKQ